MDPFDKKMRLSIGWFALFVAKVQLSFYIPSISFCAPEIDLITLSGFFGIIVLIICGCGQEAKYLMLLNLEFFRVGYICPFFSSETGQ